MGVYRTQDPEVSKIDRFWEDAGFNMTGLNELVFGMKSVPKLSSSVYNGAYGPVSMRRFDEYLW